MIKEGRIKTETKDIAEFFSGADVVTRNYEHKYGKQIKKVFHIVKYK